MATHDVRTAGATGDGRTDDTAALQAAIDACAYPMLDPAARPVTSGCVTSSFQ